MVRNADDEVVYSLEMEGLRLPASSLDVQFQQMYLLGNQVAFLQKVRSSGARHKETSYLNAGVQLK